MVYRGYRRGRYSRRRRGYPRKGTGQVDYVKMATSAYKGVKYIKSLINVEKKSIEINQANNPDIANPTIMLLSGVATGDDETNRDGRSILAQSIYLRCGVSLANSGTSSVVRMILFTDKNSNGVAPTANELLVAPTGTQNYLTAVLNQDNAGSRFKVLKDKLVTVSDGTVSTRVVTMFKKLYHHIKFDGITANQADCVSGHLYLFLTSNESVNFPSVPVNSRLMFTDN